MLAKYIYEGIKKLDGESLAKYEDLAGFQSHEEDIDVYEVFPSGHHFQWQNVINLSVSQFTIEILRLLSNYIVIISLVS